ncbi:hypothetical protein [Nocardia ninae]|nr:hypothetical protein [Nocardia ninae]
MSTVIGTPKKNHRKYRIRMPKPGSAKTDYHGEPLATMGGDPSHTSSASPEVHGTSTRTVADIVTHYLS